MKKSAPAPKTAPLPRAVTFVFSSVAASSSSSRASALACSATCFAAPPSVCSSVAWVCMASPVDHLGDEDAGHERGAQDDERVGTALSLPAAELRPRRCDEASPRLLIRRRLASGAGGHQARLQLAQERGVLRQLLGELRLHAAVGRGFVGQLLQAVGRPPPQGGGPGHFFSRRPSPAA